MSLAFTLIDLDGADAFSDGMITGIQVVCAVIALLTAIAVIGQFTQGSRA